MAVLDMGASALRLLVAEMPPGEPPRILEEASRAVALGKDVFTTGRLGASAIEAALRALEGFRRIMDSYGVARYRAGIENGVWPERIAPVIGALICSVRVHGKQHPRIGVRKISVFPARIEYASVLHYRRIPAVFLVKSQLAHVATLVSPFARSFP